MFHLVFYCYTQHTKNKKEDRRSDKKHKNTVIKKNKICFDFFFFSSAMEEYFDSFHHGYGRKKNSSPDFTKLEARLNEYSYSYSEYES